LSKVVRSHPLWAKRGGKEEEEEEERRKKGK